MGNLHLVTGYAGVNHITSADHGAMHAHLLRSGDFVLAAGGNLAAAIVTNNQVRISDGELMQQGRHVRLAPGTYVDMTIDNGAQDMRRHDLIVARYTRDPDTGIEDSNLVVLKGTAAASNPADPSITTGDLNANKDTLHDTPLYRVRLNGLNIEGVDALFEPQPSLYDLATGPASHDYTGTLTTSGWSGSAPYTQTITVNGIKGSDVPFVDVNLAGVNDSGTAVGILEAWMLVGRISASADNKITAYCYEEKPAVNIPILLKVVD